MIQYIQRNERNKTIKFATWLNLQNTLTHTHTYSHIKHIHLNNTYKQKL